MHLKFAALLMLGAIAVTACQENVAPDAERNDTNPSFAEAAAAFGEGAAVSPLLAKMNAQLAVQGSKLRVSKAEMIVDPKAWDAASPTVLIANNRVRGLAYEWVSGDTRRDGRVGVTYAVDPVLTHPDGPRTRPLTRDPDGTNLRSVPNAQLDLQIEEGMTAWRNQSCSNAPIVRVPVPAGTDPDQLDQFFAGQPTSSNYAQPADIVQSGWLPRTFFEAIQPGGGGGIIGVAFSFTFVDDNGTPTPADDVETDVNGDGKGDTGLVEIYYNTNFAWGTTQALNVVDFYSIIAHETGHALSLAHFGKVFVTKKDATDGIQIADIKYAPYALMNAVYVTGRNEIAGTDNSSFCFVWSNEK